MIALEEDSAVLSSDVGYPLKFQIVGSEPLEPQKAGRHKTHMISSFMSVSAKRFT